MTVQDALDIIRVRTNDTQSRIYTNAELIQYVNLACVAVVNQMIAQKNGDAIAAMGGDDQSMRRLIRAHPEWRCSEGGI